MKTILRSAFFCLLILLAACGTLEVSLDRTPTPDLGAKATLDALQTQVAALDPLSQPLTMDSTSETIRLKLLRSYTFWKAIFIDGIVTREPPEGSNQLPQTFREQIWIDQPTNSYRRIGGPAGGVAEYFNVSNGQSQLEIDLKTGLSQTNNLPGFALEPYNPPSTITDTIYPHPLSGQMGPPFGDLIFSSGLGQREGEFLVVAMEVTAGRPCLVVDWFRPDGARPARYWIDVQTGVILREQDFGKSGGDVVQNEYIVNKVKYDDQFSSDLFNFQMSALPQFSDPQWSSQLTATPPVTTAPGKDLMGQVYFFVTDHKYNAETVKFVRLPGSCVVGAAPCPEVETIPTPFPLNFSLTPLVWSPDGKMAAYTYPISQDGNTAGLYLFNPDGKSWDKLTEALFIDPPIWSPDGQWLVYRVQDGLGSEEINAIHPDGSGLINLTASSKLHEEERPYVINGWINNNVILRSGNGTVYLMRVDDGFVKPLFNTPWTKSDLVPSPDGSLLAYSDVTERKTVLKILTPDGNNMRDLVTFQDGQIYPIIWSSDGMQIAFAVTPSYPASGQDIYIVGRDGRNLQQVYHSLNGIDSFSLSSDGKFMIVADMDATGRHLFVVDMSTLEQHMLQVPVLRLDWWWLAPSWQPPSR